MHPANAEFVEWDHGNEAELARHRIDPTEVEDLFVADPVWVPNRRNRKGDWKMIGPTSSGRRLTIVLRAHPSRRTIRPITGWDSTLGEQTRYLNH